MSISSAITSTGTAPLQPVAVIQRIQDSGETGEVRPTQDGKSSGDSGNGSEPQGNTGTVGVISSAQNSPKSVGTSSKGQESSGIEPNKAQPKKDQVEQAVAKVNDYLQKMRNREVLFSVDDKSGRMIIKVMDTSTKKVIQQIPPEAIVRISDSIGNLSGSIGSGKGLLMESQA